MLKKALKNFYSNAVYVFIAMGIFYLFLIIVTYSFLYNTVAGAGNMIGSIFDLVGSAVGDSEAAVKGFFDYAAGQINWQTDIASVIKQIIDTNWLQNTVTGFLQTLDVTTENFTAEFSAILSDFAGGVLLNFVVGLIILFFGVCLANWVTGYAIRRKTAKRSLFQYILNLVLQPVFNAVVIFAMVWLLAVLKGYALLLFVVLGIAYEIISLTFSWLIFGRRRVPFKKVINLRNIGMNFLAAVIIIAINIAVMLILGLLNIFIAVLIAIPVVIYSVNILSVNEDSYIRSLALAEKKEETPVAEAAAADDRIPHEE